MMISIAASRILRAAAERQREQQTASNQLRLNGPSISAQGNQRTATQDQSLYLRGVRLGQKIGRASCRERVSSPV